MKNNFENVILIIVFNYAEHVEANRNFLLDLYKNNFKKIVFYSDLPKDNSKLVKDVNYIDIHRGFFTHAIFPHFHSKYKVDLEESDGVFYSMDDNLININVLNPQNNKKILYSKYLHKFSSIEDIGNFWHWGNPWGKPALKNLIEDTIFKKYSITSWISGWSDWFYIPKKFLTNELFEAFKAFAKHKVFLEISIPTILGNFIKEPESYSKVNYEYCWNPDSQRQIQAINFLDQNNLCIHPFKFSDECNRNLILNFFKKHS